MSKRCIVAVAYGEKYEMMGDLMIESFLKYNNGWEVERYYGNRIKVPTACLINGSITPVNACEIGRYLIIRELLDKYEEVLYCDNDIMWYDKYKPLKANVVLSPHYVSKLAKYNGRHYQFYAGLFNQGIIYMKGDDGRKACDFVIQETVKNPMHFYWDEGNIEPQRKGTMWLQEIESVLPEIGLDCKVDNNPGANVAFWNLAINDRRVIKENDCYFVECEEKKHPLQSIHWSSGSLHLLSRFGEAMINLLAEYKSICSNVLKSHGIIEKESFGVWSSTQIGDCLILSAAVHNVKLAHPEFDFKFVGNQYYQSLFENNNDFDNMLSSIKVLDKIEYGKGESTGDNGTHIEAQTKMLCERIGIPMVEVKSRVPHVVLTDEELKWGEQFRGKWLVNANC